MNSKFQLLHSQFQESGITVGERAHQLVVKVIGALSHVGRDALFVQHARPRNLAKDLLVATFHTATSSASETAVTAPLTKAT